MALHVLNYEIKNNIRSALIAHKTKEIFSQQ